MIDRPSNSKFKFKSGSKSGFSGYSIIIMTSFFSHFPLIPTKRTLEVIEPTEKDTISNESGNSRPTKENPQNSNDLVIDQSILGKNSPYPLADKDTQSPEMKDQRVSKSEKWHMQGYCQNVQLSNNSLAYCKTENSKTKMVPDNSCKFIW